MVHVFDRSMQAQPQSLPLVQSGRLGQEPPSLLHAASRSDAKPAIRIRRIDPLDTITSGRSCSRRCRSCRRACPFCSEDPPAGPTHGMTLLPASASRSPCSLQGGRAKERQRSESDAWNPLSSIRAPLYPRAVIAQQSSLGPQVWRVGAGRGGGPLLISFQPGPQFA